MADSPSQTYSNHRRFVPLYHYVTALLLVVYLLWSLYRLIRSFGLDSVMGLVLALAVALLFFYTRTFPLTAQDRIIRLEERLRLERLLPPELRGRIPELTPGQLIGLRFASDEEAPELCRRVLAGELKGREEIKKQIRAWRPDELRV